MIIRWIEEHRFETDMAVLKRMIPVDLPYFLKMYLEFSGITLTGYLTSRKMYHCAVSITERVEAKSLW